MRLIVCLLVLVSVSVNAKTSLEKPIIVKLSDSEIVDSESTIRKGDFSSADFKGVLVFEGIFLDMTVVGDGENVYKFKIKKEIKSSSDKNKLRNNLIEVFAPSKVEDGGLDIKVGRIYRVCAPLLPDGRYGIWRGTIIELSGNR
jgi:hypothetical protein